MMSTLHMQNVSIIGHGVPEIQGVTHRQTDSVQDLLYRCGRKSIVLDVLIDIKRWTHSRSTSTSI